MGRMAQKLLRKAPCLNPFMHSAQCTLNDAEKLGCMRGGK